MCHLKFELQVEDDPGPLHTYVFVASCFPWLIELIQKFPKKTIVHHTAKGSFILQDRPICNICDFTSMKETELLHFLIFSIWLYIRFLHSLSYSWSPARLSRSNIFWMYFIKFHQLLQIGVGPLNVFIFALIPPPPPPSLCRLEPAAWRRFWIY